MSIIAKIPLDSRVRTPQNRFAAPFGGGFYDFSIAANTNQLVFNLNPSCIYLVERDNFSANLIAGVWLEGQLTTAEFPRFVLTRLLTPDVSVYAEPSRCLNYKDNDEKVSYFKTDQIDDQLLITFIGKVKQTASMNFATQLITQVSFTIYQIGNPNWIKWFNSPERDFEAVGLFQK